QAIELPARICCRGLSHGVYLCGNAHKCKSPSFLRPTGTSGARIGPPSVRWGPRLGAGGVGTRDPRCHRQSAPVPASETPCGAAMIVGPAPHRPVAHGRLTYTSRDED